MITMLLLSRSALFTLPHYSFGRHVVLASNGQRHACRRAILAADHPVAFCDDDTSYTKWATSNGVVFSKVRLRPGETLHGQGAVAAESIEPLEVIASVPRRLVLTTDEWTGWEARLAEAALLAQFSNTGATASLLRPWVAGWRGGGWATNVDDLNELDRNNVIGGSLLTTGSDNDVEIYRKFALPCHPVVDRAARSLASLSGASLAAARAALRAHGFAFRACRDRLAPLVSLDAVRSRDQPTGTLSVRERRNFEVARCFSLVLARVASIDGVDSAGNTIAIVPFHELLKHCDNRGANTKLVGVDPRAPANADAPDVLLVATRAIAAGEALTRNYIEAPRLEDAPPPENAPTGGSVTRPPGEDDATLRLLLQSGIRPR